MNVSKFDSTLLTASSNLKDFIHQYTHDKEIFDLQERHNSTEVANKSILSENYINRCLFVHYCNNFFTGYNFDSIFIM